MNNKILASQQVTMSEESARTDLTTAVADAADSSVKLSKRQLKRLKKKERWQEVKHLKRAKDKERKKQRKREALERGEDLGPSRKELKHNKMVNSNCQQRVVLDCSFDHLMGDKAVSKLVKQIGRTYAINRRAENPLQCYITSLGDKTKAKLEAFGGYSSWDVHIEGSDYMSVFNKEDVVYLTSESPNIVNTLDERKVYIIGGLVDYNHQKGICYDLAVEKGISHGQLPIGEYVKMKTRKVLTVDQVFEILLRFTETNDWETAFLKVIPLRKGVVALGGEETINRTSDRIKEENVNGAEEKESKKNRVTDNTSMMKLELSDSESSSEGSSVDPSLTDNTSLSKNEDSLISSVPNRTNIVLKTEETDDS